MLARSRSIILVLLSLGCASTQQVVEKQQELPPARLVRPAQTRLNRVLEAGKDIRRDNTPAPLIVDVTYQVVISPDGTPDMSSLKVLGKEAYAVKPAIAEWIGGSTFEAFKTNGVPVQSIFKGDLRSASSIF